MKLRDSTEVDEGAPWVERETLVETSPEEVWEALTDEDRLEEWMAPDVELDPVEGGEIAVRDGDDERSGTVETVEEGERFAFTWSRPGEGESFVEFTIEALHGGSRVTVVETPTHSAATNTAAGSIATTGGGWGPRLAGLRHALRFALVA
ncbi:MAG TPA: SRPBCC domain-containing protein [Solirubrobacterales bacterium]|nr:SRPBCC domain-containing protein [Solirubrobacterales bacterium]